MYCHLCPLKIFKQNESPNKRIHCVFHTQLPRNFTYRPYYSPLTLSTVNSYFHDHQFKPLKHNSNIKSQFCPHSIFIRSVRFSE